MSSRAKLPLLQHRASVFGPFGRGRCGNTAGSSARCTRRAPTPTEFLLGRRPKLPAPLEPTRILPAARLHPPHGPALPSAVAYSDCPSPPGAPADRPLPEPPFPARGGLPAAPAPSAPASTRGHSIPFGRLGYPPGRWLRFGRGLGSTRAKRRRGRRPSNAGRRGTRPSGFVYGGPGSTRATSHSGGKPPQSMRCRDSASRLRTRATFGLRSLAGAVEERHRARRPTVPALSSTPVPGPTLLVAQPTTSTLRGPAPTPARGWV
jgi:hypothetical protein